MGLWHFNLLTWLSWTSITLQILYSRAQTTDGLEEFKRIFETAATEVLQQHIPEPPDFQMPANFMHSFLPDTGVGNREDLVIEKTRYVPMFDDNTFSKWRYSRFNNWDYLMGINRTRVFLWQKSINFKEKFDFSIFEAILTHTPEYKGIVSDAVMFTRYVKHTEVLYVAVLTENQKSSLITIYEIINDKGIMVTAIDLGINTATELVQPASKLAYVESRHGGSLVVLVANSGRPNVVYQQKGSNVLNHYIEVQYPSAVDFVSFSVAGHGYLAVANRTMCEVYKMDEFVQNHLVFERIPFANIVDLEYFRLGFHHYLAVSSEDYQSLYLWKTGELSQKQEIFSSGVRQLYSASLPTCRDDVILFLIKEASVEVYIWNGQKDKFTVVDIPSFPPSRSKIQPYSITSFSYSSTAFVLFVDGSSDSQIYAIDTSLKSVADPVLLVGKEVSSIMKHLKDMLDYQEKRIKDMSTVLINAVRSNGNHIITAFQAFTDIHSTEALLNLERTPPVIQWEGSELTVEEFLAGTQHLEAGVNELEDTIQKLEARIPDVVRVDEDAVITGAKTFTGDVFGSSISAISLDIQTAAGYNISELQKQLYRSDKPETIKGVLSFEKPLTITGNLDVEETINGIDFGHDVMTIDTNQISHAHMNFDNKLTVLGNLTMSGRLNGVDVGTEVVTLYGDHIITGTKSFLNGIIADNVETVLVDGVDIKDLYKRALTQSGNQAITGTKDFVGTLHTKDITLYGSLNGYNLVQLADNIVRTDKPAMIQGHKTFLDDVAIHSNLTVTGTIDGRRIPEDLFMPGKTKVVTGMKEFTGEVTVNDIVVSGTVDGLSLPRDIITLTKDETIYNTLFFTDGITVKGDVVVDGLVDGVDISKLFEASLKLNETTGIKNAVFLGPVTVLGDIVVEGTVNGVQLEHLVKDIVYKDDKNVVIEAEKSFKKLTAESVHLNKMINGYNIERDFMLVKGNQTIYGTKTFKSPVTFQTLSTANGIIDGVNIAQLYNERISLSFDQDLDGDIEFVDHLIVNGSLTVHGTLAGLNFPNDIVLKSTEQTISNKVFSGNLQISNLIVNGNIKVHGTFGGQELPEFFDEIVTLSTDQDIIGDLTLGNTTATRVVIDGLVNGMNITEFASNVMSLTKNQTVTAFKEFSGNTTIRGPITTDEGINGINLADINHRAFKILEDNVITVPFSFKDPIVFHNFTADGLINDVNITHLDEDSVKKEGIQYIRGVNVFHKGFHVDGDITADTVNGLNLYKDILTKSSPQTITGSYTFSNVGVEGNVAITGLVNGLDLSEVVPLLAKTDENNVISSNLIFQAPVHVAEDIEVSGFVNGIDLKELEQTALLKTGQQYISGRKVLKGNVTVYGDINTTFLNDIRWADFLQDVVRTDIPQSISGPKTWLSDLEVRGDVYVSGHAEIGSVNGIFLQKFLDDAVFLNQPANITGVKIFTSPVEITGDLTAELINGLKLQKDVIILQCNDDSSQIITGEKTFQDLSVFGDIAVSKTVNGYKLYELMEDTLTIDGNQVITGHKTFHAPVEFLKDVHSESVNGMSLRHELVTLNTDQEISGELIFNNDIHVNKDLEISGLLNNVDIQQLSRDALYLDTPQEIEGSYSIDHAVIKSNLFVDGTVNDMDLSGFYRNVTLFWDERKKDLKSLNNISAEQCTLTKYLHSVLEQSYYVLDGFLPHQDLGFSSNGLNISPSGKELSLIQLIDSGSSAVALNHRWVDSEQKFAIFEKIKTTIVRRQIYQFAGQELVINIAVQPKDSSVTIKGVPIPSISQGFKNAAAIIKSKVAYMALLFPERGLCEIYKIDFEDSSNLSVKPFGNLKVEEVTALAMFEMSQELYLAFSCSFAPRFSMGSSKLFAWIKNDWQLVQNIPAPASSHVSHFHYHGYHYLAFTNSVPVYEAKEPKSVQIYRNNGDTETTFSLFQKVPFDNAKMLELFDFGGVSELYLTAFNDSRIQVFRLEGESGFKSNFTLHGKCITTVKPFIVEQDLFLAVGQYDEELKEPLTTLIYKGLTQGSILPQRKFKHCP